MLIARSDSCDAARHLAEISLKAASLNNYFDSAPVALAFFSINATVTPSVISAQGYGKITSPFYFYSLQDAGEEVGL